MNRLLVLSVASWGVILASSLSARMLFAASAPSPAEGLMWLVGATAPLVVAFSLSRGASSRTIAQVLYDVEHPVLIESKRAGHHTNRASRS